MIIRFPALPPLNPGGGFAGPAALLYGGAMGAWQEQAASVLSKVAKAVIVTDTDWTVRTWGLLREYLSVVDVVVVWCGCGVDGLRALEWIYVGYLVGCAPSKLVVGVADREAHPMAPALEELYQQAGLTVFGAIEDVVAAAAQRCRLRRG